MKKKIGLICILAFTGLLSVHAQNNITVHDERTNKDEVIELPEGMTSDIDSLLNEWHIKNYLSEDEGCEAMVEYPLGERRWLHVDAVPEIRPASLQGYDCPQRTLGFDGRFIPVVIAIGFEDEADLPEPVAFTEYTVNRRVLEYMKP